MQRLDRVDRAAARKQERTLFMALFAKSQQGRRAAQVTPLEFRPGEPDVLGQTRNILAGDIHEALLLAAANASGLAFKAHGRVYREFRKGSFI